MPRRRARPYLLKHDPLQTRTNLDDPLEIWAIDRLLKAPPEGRWGGNDRIYFEERVKGPSETRILPRLEVSRSHAEKMMGDGREGLESGIITFRDM